MWEHDFVTEVEYDEVLTTLGTREKEGWELIGQHRYSQQSERYTYVYYDLFFKRAQRKIGTTELVEEVGPGWVFFTKHEEVADKLAKVIKEANE